MAMETEGLTELANTQEVPVVSPPPKSFKEALDIGVDTRSSDEDDDEQRGISTTDEVLSDHMGIPMISLPKKLLERIRKPWENALIIRLLGKNIGYKMLCTRVAKIWALQGEFTTIDLGSNYFLFKFAEKEDYTKVYTRGPWVIMDHYRTVRRWEPNFKPSEALETTTAIWVRFPELPIEYYQEKVLYAIVKSIGKPLKIDWTTAMATRGKFARICVEMDLTKPLKPKFILEGRYYNIEYESLHSFCFLCGRIDHRKEAYQFKALPSPPLAKNIDVSGEQTLSTGTAATNGNLQHRQFEEDAFGPWMLATKRGRRPAQIKKSPTPQQNRFKYLEEGPDGQGESSRGRNARRAGLEKAQGESNPQIDPHHYDDSKSKTKIGLAQHTDVQPKSNQKQSDLEPMEEIITNHAREIVSETISSDQVVLTKHDNGHLTHSNQSDITCSLPVPSHHIDSTMVESIHLQTQLAQQNPNISISQNTLECWGRDLTTPDPGDLRNETAKKDGLRAADTRGTRACEADQCNESVVRTRKRSNSPRCFRMVDRTNPTNNRAKLGEYPCETIPLGSDGLHAISRGRSSEDTQHH
ncbi:hypothetical protein ACSBR2_006279 [Camellia fascicularis]